MGYNYTSPISDTLPGVLLRVLSLQSPNDQGTTCPIVVPLNPQGPAMFQPHLSPK